MKINKTNAARVLDKEKILYRMQAYEVDENDLSAAHLAAQLGEDPAKIFKTLVLKGDKTGYLVCVVPGDAELDLKKAARLSGNKSCAMIPVKDLQNVTGYIRGGCSPLAMKKRFPTFIDESVELWPEVYVSAGLRGVQLVVPPDGLVRAAGAVVGDLVMA